MAKRVVEALREIAKGIASAVRAPTMLVCFDCLHEGDDIVSDAGDYAACERCGESITSKTGVTVR